MRHYLLNVTLYALVTLFSASTHEDGTNLSFLSLVLLLVAAAVASLFLLIWWQGPFWQRLLAAAKWCFPLAAILFLAGYWFEAWYTTL
jgi:hypothetical protein